MRNSTLFILAFMLVLNVAHAQDKPTWQQEIDAFQQELNQKYADPAQSPLPPAAITSFKSLPFFPVDSGYRVMAKFVRTPGQLPFEMPTTTNRKAVYEKYGELHFKLQGQAFILSVYQNHALRNKEGYEDYLFLPFTDPTNGTTSYGGGRYIDFSIPKSEAAILDFNKAYNPYCAYNYGYSCPIPPKENRLTVAVKAGVMAPH